MMKLEAPVQSDLSRKALSRLKAYLKPHLAAHVSQGSETTNGRKQGLRNENLKVTHVLSMYVVTLSQLAKADLKNAKPAGSLLLVGSPQHDTMLMEVESLHGSKVSSRVTSGRTVETLQRALRTCEALPRGEDNIPRVIWCPALHLRALESAGDSKFYLPFTSNLASLVPGRKYTDHTFVSRTKSAAMTLILRWYEIEAEKRMKASGPSNFSVTGHR